MNIKYREGKQVPTEMLCARLRVLSNAVCKGRDSIAREFYMSVPARHEIDADLILTEAAERIIMLDAKVKDLYGSIRNLIEIAETEEKS